MIRKLKTYIFKSYKKNLIMWKMPIIVCRIYSMILQCNKKKVYMLQMQTATPRKQYFDFAFFYKKIRKLDYFRLVLWILENYFLE